MLKIPQKIPDFKNKCTTVNLSTKNVYVYAFLRIMLVSLKSANWKIMNMFSNGASIHQNQIECNR